jgi:hypothetical protein
MNFLLKLLGVTILTIFISNCSEGTIEPSINDDVILPLALGNTWEYICYQYPISNPDSISQSMKLISIIDSVYTINGKKWYGLRTYNPESPEAGMYIQLRNVREGLRFLDNPYNFAEILYFKYPTVINESIIWDNYKTDRIDTTVTISINSETTVPAGKFTCIHYQRNGDDDEYYCPNIGQIKSSIKFINTFGNKSDTLIMCMELNSYSLK